MAGQWGIQRESIRGREAPARGWSLIVDTVHLRMTAQQAAQVVERGRDAQAWRLRLKGVPKELQLRLPNTRENATACLFRTMLRQCYGKLQPSSDVGKMLRLENRTAIQQSTAVFVQVQCLSTTLPDIASRRTSRIIALESSSV